MVGLTAGSLESAAAVAGALLLYSAMRDAWRSLRG